MSCNVQVFSGVPKNQCFLQHRLSNTVDLGWVIGFQTWWFALRKVYHLRWISAPNNKKTKKTTRLAAGEASKLQWSPCFRKWGIPGTPNQDMDDHGLVLTPMVPRGCPILGNLMKRREFSGMIQNHIRNVIIPATPSNPQQPIPSESIPYVKRSSKIIIDNPLERSKNHTQNTAIPLRSFFTADSKPQGFRISANLSRLQGSSLVTC